jgi:type II secretory pathway component PulF
VKRFVYEASDQSGNVIKRTFVGTKSEFQNYIKQHGFFLYSIKEENLKIEKGNFKDKDLKSFFEELLYLIQSGMPIDQALKNLYTISTKSEVKFFVERILLGLKDGKRFSEALNQSFEYVNYNVDDLVKSLIVIGEEIGELDKSIERALEHMEYKSSVGKQIKKAIRYPLFLLIMSILMVFFVFWFVVPKFASMFTPEEFEQLPWLSYHILSLGKAVDENMFMIAVGTLTLGILLWLSIKKYNQIWFKLMYYIGFFNKLFFTIEMSYIFRSLSVMLEGGVKIEKAISRVLPLIRHQEIASLFNIARDEIRKGGKLSRVFFESDHISPNVASLISVGENSANLETIFASLSVKLGDEFQDRVSKVLSFLEPIIIIVVGVFIALIVVSIMLAVVSLTDLTV